MTKIKPLEWDARNEGFGHGRIHYGFGVFRHWYGVRRIKTGSWECFYHLGGTTVRLPLQSSLEIAKAEAQADYEKHMLGAIA
jgi:hypothetical protein